MKTPIKYILAMAIMVFPSAKALCQLTAQPPLINVSGSAEVKVAPDEIYLKVGVETREEKLEDAERETDSAISKSLAFLKSNGVKEKDVQTDFISLEPTYDNNVSRTRVVAYVVRKSIDIKLTDIKSFETIFGGLLTNGINTVQGIEFRTSELRKHRDKARAMAIRAAKEKADAMAGELGVKRGKVYSINVNDGGGWWNGYGGSWGGRFGGAMFQNAMVSAEGGSGEEGTMSAGQISVSATVNVSFLIE